MARSTVNRRSFTHALKKLYDFVDTLAETKKYALTCQINSTDLLAPTSQQLVVPHAGYLNEYKLVVQVAVTTGGAVKLQKNTVDITGATVTIGDAAAAGTVYQATVDEIAVAEGDVIAIVPAAAIATAGSANVSIGFTAD
jgi:hypothetical protein